MAYPNRGSAQDSRKASYSGPLLISLLGTVVLLSAASPAAAQRHGRAPSAVAGGHAVPRGPGAQVVRPQIGTAVPYRYYRPYYRPGLSFYYGYPYAYGSLYGYGYPVYGYPYGYGYPAYGYPAYGYPAYGYSTYGYGASGYRARPYGGVRIDLPQKDAEVYSDGYYVGMVGDFDGVSQELTLEAGPHRIEIRAPGFEPIAFDVNVQPGRTITYRAALQPQRP